MQMPMFFPQMPMMPQMMGQPMPAAMPAMPREENNDTSSDDDIEQAGRERRKKILTSVLSTSFKCWGGELRPITRTARHQFVAETHPSLDLEVVARLSNRDFDKFTWVIYGVRPDTKLCNVNLTGGTMAEVIVFLRKGMKRVARANGMEEGGLQGLSEDFANLEHVASSMGYNDAWFCERPLKPAKGGTGLSGQVGQLALTDARQLALTDAPRYPDQAHNSCVKKQVDKK